MTGTLLQTLLVVVLLTAVVTDLQSYRIPNWLTMPAMACGLLTHTLLNGPGGLIISLGGLGLGFGLFLVFYVTGGMGAGDVKLMGAVGSVLGPAGVLSAAVAACLLGGVYAATTMIAHCGLRETNQRVMSLLLTRALPKGPDASAISRSEPQLRYALVIALGTLLSQMFIVR